MNKTSFVYIHELNYETITFTTLYSIIFVFGIIANLTVIFVYLYENGSKKRSCLFFVSLSTSDILILVVCVPISITDLYTANEWHYSSTYCKLYYFIEYYFTSVSSFTIISISVERYYAVYDPLRVRFIFDKKKSVTILSFIWVISFIISLPFFWMVEFTTDPNQCQFELTMYRLAYILTFNISFIFLPTIGLFILYVFIIAKVGKLVKPIDLEDLEKKRKIRDSLELAKNYGTELQPKNQKTAPSLRKDSLASQLNTNRLKNSKYTIIISIVAIIFYCGQLPVRIFQSWSYTHYYVHMKTKPETHLLDDLNIDVINFINRVSSLIYYLHCISNPIIYNFLSTKFREGFQSISNSRRSSQVY